MRALDPQRYEVLSIAIRRDGTWVPGETDPAALDFENGLTEVGPSHLRVIIPPGDGKQDILELNTEDNSVRSLGRVDVVFPVLHGAFGEDGTIQGLLEMANLRYVGSGVLASAAGMDKHFMKEVLRGAGLPVGPYVGIPARSWEEMPLRMIARTTELKAPLYVKPARAGSSIGIQYVAENKDVPYGIAEAQEFDPKVIVEQGVVGREIECAVIGGEIPRASELGEIVLAQEGFYDFESKYVQTEGLKLEIPAQLPESVAAQMREMAIDAYNAFECEGLVRVDFFYTEDGQILINEINTMPGFTPYSMYPALWQASGLSYEELVDELVQLALQRPLGLR